MQSRVTHACGHTAPVTLLGPGRERQARLAALAKRPCGDCLAAETARRAEAQAAARDLPPLVGTARQVAFAATIRYRALTLLDRLLRDADPVAIPRALPVPDALPGEPDLPWGEMINRLYERDTARWWIDHGRPVLDAGRASDLPGIGWHDASEPETVAVARLLWAAGGVAPVPDRQLRALAACLAPAAGVLRRRVDDATLDAHIARARAAIRAALRDAARPYVAVSGGKDSAAVAHLVLSERPDVTLLWSDDELEYPETVALMTALKDRHGAQLVTALGWAEHAGWFRPWTDRPLWRDPLPGTRTAGMDADDWMATRGHDLTLLGTRAEESRVRAAWLVEHGPTYRVRGGTGVRCCPLWDWPVGYVYAYLERVGVALNGAYAVLERIGVPEELRRVGPLPLARRDDLAAGWPALYDRLVARYGHRWT